MSIKLIDNFQVDVAKPIDERLVVGPGQKYTNKDSITSKYIGLRVWDITENNGFVWNGNSWISDSNGGSTSLPIGSIIIWFQSGTLPNGFFECDGETYSLNGSNITVPNLAPINGNIKYIVFLGSVDEPTTTSTTTVEPTTTSTTTQPTTLTPNTDFVSKTHNSVVFSIENTDSDEVEVTWELRENTQFGDIFTQSSLNINSSITEQITITGLDSGTTYHFVNIIATADGKSPSQPDAPRQATTFFEFSMIDSGTSSQPLSCDIDLEEENTIKYWHNGETPYPILSTVIFNNPSGLTLSGGELWYKFNKDTDDISIQIDNNGVVVDLLLCQSLSPFIMSEDPSDDITISCGYSGATATFYHNGEDPYPTKIDSPDQIEIYTDAFGGSIFDGNNKWFKMDDGNSIQINTEGKVVDLKRCLTPFNTAVIGSNSDTESCSLPDTPGTRYHDGDGILPDVGDTIYTSIETQTQFPGFNLWYKIGERVPFISIQINESGLVTSTASCS